MIGVKKNSKRIIDKEIADAYNAACKGVIISVLDISKIYAAGREAAAGGNDVKEAVVAVVAAIRKN